MDATINIRVLVFQEKAKDGSCWWVAQCLEYDLATQARSLNNLPYELDRIIVTHMIAAEENGLQPFECLPPAPAWYHMKYKRTGNELKAPPERIAPQDRPLKHRVPATELRIMG